MVEPLPAVEAANGRHTVAVDGSVDDLAMQKRALKLAMRRWESDFEEANGGLVPTHEDKKHDQRYGQLKAQAKRVEHALDLGRRNLRKSVAAGGVPPRLSRMSSAATAAALTAEQLRHSSGPCGGGSSSGIGGGMGGGTGSSSLLHAPQRTRTCAAGGVRSRSLRGAGFVFDAPAGGVDDAVAGSFSFESGRISLSPFHVLSLVAACVMPHAMFILSFSLMGFGARVFYNLVTNGWLFYPLTLSAVGILVVLYLLDVSYWEAPPAVWARRLLLTFAAGTVVFGGLVASKEYPYAPLLLLFFLAPGYWWLLQRHVFVRWPLSDFLRALAHALLLLSTLIAALWIAWVLSGNPWDVPNKRRYMLHMRCCVDLTSIPRMLYDSTPSVVDGLGYATASELLALDADTMLSHLNLTASVSRSSVWDGVRWPRLGSNVSILGSPPLLEWNATSSLLEGAAIDEAGCLVLPTQPCLEVLLFYVSPFVSAAGGVVAAVLSALLERSLRTDEQLHGGLSVGGRVFILALTIGAAALWVSASVVGASMGVSKVIMLGILCLILVITILLDRIFGWKAVLQGLIAREPLARRLVRFVISSNWSRACAVAVASPLMIVGIALSALNQLIRVHVLRAIVLPAERALVVTERVHHMLRTLYAWDWTSVLRKVIVLTTFYMVWMVGVMKLTYLLFSWLTHVLTPQPLGLSTAIFSLVGMGMFLLPPVPGVPVYIASGVLLTPIAAEKIGYPLAAVYAMGVAFIIKLCACALQQKAIGATLRRSVRVRSLCMLNSPLMRALKLLMTEKGVCRRGKVATLVGGPDWPTSVMMGLLGMELAPMLIGTMPVILLVAPASLTGTFLTMGTTPYPALANIALTAVAVTQVGAFLAMMVYVERAGHDHRDALETMPYDLEVLELDRAELEYAALYAELSAWQSSNLPFVMRLLLVIGAILGTAACWGATLFNDDCFRDFVLYIPFEIQLRDSLGGSVSNIVRTPGYAVLGAWLLSFICREIFKCWASRLTRARYAAGQRAKATPTRTCTRRADTRRASDRGLASSTSSDVTAYRPSQPSLPLRAAAETTVPGGGRKLSKKSKPFWELQQEREARQAAASGQATPPSHRGDVDDIGVSAATKDRPPRHEHHRRRHRGDRRSANDATAVHHAAAPLEA
jgi:hypothetical protein